MFLEPVEFLFCRLELLVFEQALKTDGTRHSGLLGVGLGFEEFVSQESGMQMIFQLQFGFRCERPHPVQVGGIPRLVQAIARMAGGLGQSSLCHECGHQPEVRIFQAVMGRIAFHKPGVGPDCTGTIPLFEGAFSFFEKECGLFSVPRTGIGVSCLAPCRTHWSHQH